MKKGRYGMALMSTIIAAAALAGMSAFAKLSLAQESYQFVLFFRFLIGSMVILPFIFLDKRITLKTTRYPLHFLRACFGFLSITLLFMSVQYLSVAEANLLLLTYPLFIPLILYFITNEKLSLNTVTSIIIGFIGVYLIRKYNSNQINSYVLVSLGAGVLASFGTICVSYLGKTEPSRRTVFYFMMHAMFFGLILVLLSSRSLPNLHVFKLLLGVGFCGLLYQQGISYALSQCSPVLILPLIYSTCIFSGALDWIVWDHIPSFRSVIGYILVILGAIMTLVNRYKRNP